MLSRFSLRLGQLLSLTVCLLALGRPTLCPAANGWWNQNLKCVGSLANLPGQAVGVEVAGDRAYLMCVTSPDTYWADYRAETGYVAVVNIHDSSDPKLIATWHPDNKVSQMTVVDKTLYLITHSADDTQTQFSTVDMTNPSALTVLGSLPLENNVLAFCLNGSRAYLSTTDWQTEQNNSLVVLDIANPRQPRLLSNAKMNRMIDKLQVVGKSLFASTYAINPDSDTYHEITRYDLANPDHPVPNGSWPINSDWTSSSGFDTLRIEKSKLYLTTLRKIWVVDSSVAGDAAIVGIYNSLASDFTGRIMDSCVVRSRIYLALGSQGVQVIDVSHPFSNDVMKGYYLTPGNAQALKVVGKHIYVATGTRGLTILE